MNFTINMHLLIENQIGNQSIEEGQYGFMNTVLLIAKLKLSDIIKTSLPLIETRQREKKEKKSKSLHTI